MNKKIIIILVLMFAVTFTLGKVITMEGSNEDSEDNISSTSEDKETTEVGSSGEVTLSFAGDVTLGNYAGQGSYGSFEQMMIDQNYDYSYFLKNVAETFANDDLTIVNLEGPLTTATEHATKKFAFKGDPSYVNVLTEGNVDVVSLANNHSEDYYQAGFEETKSTLDNAGIGYFGYETTFTKEVNGIKIGFFGYRSIDAMTSDEDKAVIKSAVDSLKEDGCDIVIAFYHWGIEKQTSGNAEQVEVAHYTIDCGADLVMGSHPHVVQNIETYNGKQIVYSLGNFCFGGNKNPSDKDSMIYQITFDVEDGEIAETSENIIPCSISSISTSNNYQPVILTGSEAERVLEKINS